MLAHRRRVSRLPSFATTLLTLFSTHHDSHNHCTHPFSVEGNRHGEVDAPGSDHDTATTQGAVMAYSCWADLTSTRSTFHTHSDTKQRIPNTFETLVIQIFRTPVSQLLDVHRQVLVQESTREEGQLLTVVADLHSVNCCRRPALKQLLAHISAPMAHSQTSTNAPSGIHVAPMFLSDLREAIPSSSWCLSQPTPARIRTHH